MAFSSSLIKSDIQGTTKVQYWSFDAASVTTGTISTGMAAIHHVSLNNEVSEAQGLVTKSNGVITITSLNANDTGTIAVHGY